MPFTAYLGDAAQPEIERRQLSYENLMGKAAENLIAEHAQEVRGIVDEARGIVTNARRWFYATLAVVVVGVPVAEIAIHHIRLV